MQKTVLTALGAIYLDINALNFPFGDGLLPETETIGNKYLMALGGSAVNIVKFLNDKNIKTSFIGKVGDDLPSKILEQLFLEKNIVPYLIKNKACQTNLGLNYVDTKGRTLMTVVGNANQSLSEYDVLKKLEQVLGQTEFLYLGGFFKLKNLQKIYEQIVSMSKSNGVKLVLDHGRVPKDASKQEFEILKKVINLVDIYLPSEDEFITVTGSNSFDEAIEKFNVKNNQILVVKRADKGAVLKTLSNGIESFPSRKIEVVNTVGAGDSFNAGFIAGIYNGYNPSQAVQGGIESAIEHITSKI